jgi:NDP-sugar pyrophosphorylase family protein
VDAVWADTILARDSMTGERILPLVISPGEWIDIDSPEDWLHAENLLESGEITLEDLGFDPADWKK